MTTKFGRRFVLQMMKKKEEEERRIALFQGYFAKTSSAGDRLCSVDAKKIPKVRDIRRKCFKPFKQPKTVTSTTTNSMSSLNL
jgi:hypothetical protein